MPSALRARLRRAVPRMTRRRAVAGSIVVVLLAGLLTWASWPEPVLFDRQDQMITVRSGPGGDQPVSLDTSYYVPDVAGADRPVPAVLLAHGFGGTKRSVRTDAEELAARGYAVLTWTARGFGRSGGQIHLNDPDHEVRDAQRLLDWLAARPEVRTDGSGDPRVGVVGGSYGGALALLLAAQDERVDAIVPMITWNDLARAFLPEATGEDPAAGVFKRTWAGLFFGSGSAGPGAGAGLPAADPAAGLPGGEPGAGAPGSGPDQAAPGDVGPDPSCGRFAADVCAAYQQIATTGRADAAALARLLRSSPAPVLDRVAAPTLLIQGAGDTLFPLSEADANARAIAANGTPVRLAWFTGGHDSGAGPQADQDRLKFLTAGWLDHHVAGTAPAPASSFTYSRVTGFNVLDRGLASNGYSVADYPGLAGTGTAPVTVTGPARRIANPPSGTPAAISSIPFGGALRGASALASGLALEIPGQHAEFLSEPLAEPVEVVGAPTVSIRAASPTGEAVLFVKLYDVDGGAGPGGPGAAGGGDPGAAADPATGGDADSGGPGGDTGGAALAGLAGGAVLPGNHVAPVRLTGLPADIAEATPVTVTLPAIVHRFETGHRLRIVVATSDQAYATPAEPVVYTVGLGGAGGGTGPGTATSAAVTLPTVTGEPIASQQALWRYLLVALLIVIVIGLLLAVLISRWRHRRADRTVAAEYADTPLVVRDLRKEYADGFVAVRKISFEVRRGQVVGLLGPNGAGKTTTLRALMGLTRPTAGEILVFGHRLTPGAPVLSRIGALVEGPGFLPHLTGLENLRAYWRATGRPDEQARFDEALEIAGLGQSIHRRVRTYSHGMRQRLAIAQAMLGLPEILVLDEPTDGLDPPQIAEMRQVLRRYATNDRAVLVSSHLLAEVEQTCTHAVVVHKGEIVASGLVDDIVGESLTVQIDVSDVTAARAVLDGLAHVHPADDGATADRTTGDRSAADGVTAGGLVVDVNGTPRSELVAELVRAGVGVDRVMPRRRLEDAFLALVGDNSRGSGDR